MRFVWLFILLLSGPILMAQEDSTLVVGKPDPEAASGISYAFQGVITGPDGKIVAGATLFLQGANKGVTSNASGQFRFTVPAGNYRLVIRYLGLKTSTIKVIIHGSGWCELALKEDAQALEEITISAQNLERSRLDPVSGSTSLSVAELQKIPPFLGEPDLLKSVQMLPGVTTVGEGASGLNVRGGRTDQNLIMIDGIALYNTSHALGFISLINPDLVDRFTLYKGFIPANYGGRTSSVMDVGLRTGADEWKTTLNPGVFSGRVSIEGPVVKEKVNLIVGARKSYTQWLLNSVPNPDINDSRMNFGDLTARLTVKFSPSSKLDFFQLISSDRFRFTTDFGYNYATTATGLRYSKILSSNWAFQLTGGRVRYSAVLTDPSGPDARSISSALQHYQTRAQVVYNSEKLNALFGVEAIRYKGEDDKLRTYLNEYPIIPKNVDRDTGLETGIYGNAEWEPTEKISLTGGLRISGFTQAGNDRIFQYEPGKPRTLATLTDTLYFDAGKSIHQTGGIEPRISIRYSLAKNLALKAGAGKSFQYIHLVTNSAAPSPVDVWQLTTRYLKPQEAVTYSIGLFGNSANNKFEYSLEGYYRKSSNLLEYKDFPELLLNEHLETELIAASGKSYGVEVLLKKNLGLLTGWISYTWSRTFVRTGTDPALNINNGKWFPSNVDKPHSVAIIVDKKIGIGGISLQFTYQTGRPVTAILSNYQSNGITIPVYSDRNAYRIPDYIRTDLSISFGGFFKNRTDDLKFSVYNLFGRNNAYSVYYITPPGFTIPQGYKLSIIGNSIPSLSYSITF